MQEEEEGPTEIPLVKQSQRRPRDRFRNRHGKIARIRTFGFWREKRIKTLGEAVLSTRIGIGRHAESLEVPQDLEYLSHRDDRAPDGVITADDTDGSGVPGGEHGRDGRPSPRRRRDGVLEYVSFLGQFVQMWGETLIRPVAADMVGSERVNDDEHDTRRRLVGGFDGWRGWIRNGRTAAAHHQRASCQPEHPRQRRGGVGGSRKRRRHHDERNSLLRQDVVVDGPNDRGELRSRPARPCGQPSRRACC